MDDSQQDSLDPSIAELERLLTQVIDGEQPINLSSRVNAELIRPLLDAVQYPASWTRLTTDSNALDRLLGEFATGANPDVWVAANGSRIAQLHRTVVQEVLAAVDNWEREEDSLQESLEPVWQIVRWLALDSERQASTPPPFKRRPGQAALALFSLRVDLAVAANRAPTLQEVGDQAGVTRERVRQVLVRCDEFVEPYREAVEQFRRWLRRTGLILPLAAIRISEEPRLAWALATLVDQFQIVIDPMAMTISGYTKEEIATYLHEQVSEARRHQFASPLVNPVELKAWISRLHSGRAWSPLGIEPVLSRIGRAYLDPGNTHAVWRGTSRTEQLAFILSQYPDGFALYKGSDTLVAKLADLFGEDGVTAQSLATRASESPHIHLWGHGLYLHENFIPAPTPLLDAVVAWISERFSNEWEEVSVFTAWEMFAQQCADAAIPTPAALYTWIRLNADDRVSAPRYPTILPVGNDRRMSRGAIIRELIRTEGPLSLAELSAHCRDKRGWSSQETANTTGHLLDVYRGDDEKFTLTEWVPERQQVLANIGLEVQSALAHAPLLSVISLFLSHRGGLTQLGIAGPRTLWGILREGLYGTFRFGHYPMVTRLEAAGQANLRAAAIAVIERHGSPITRPMIEQILTQEHGVDAPVMNLATSTDEIMLYRGHPANLYIHRNWLEWNESKQAQLDACVTDVLTNLATAEPPIGYIDGLLLCRTDLPALGRGLSWTRELLLDFLRLRADCLVLGTRRRLLVPAANTMGIETDLDLAGYILARQFGGQAAFAVWVQALIRLDFCKQFPMGYYEDPAAPFVIAGDRVTLRKDREDWLLRAPRVLVWQGAETMPAAAISPELVGTPEVDELLASLFGED